MNEPKHPLAILRRTIGLKQKEMADLLECSLPTIQAIEYGKLMISEKLVGLIAYKTGVSTLWIRHGLGPMTDTHGKPYPRQSYEQHQAVLFAPAQDAGRIENQLMIARGCFLHMVDRLAILFTNALRRKNVTMCHYKVGCATDEVLAETGTYKSLTQDENTRWNWIRFPDQPKEEETGPGPFSYADWVAQKIRKSACGEELIRALEVFIDNTEAVYQEQIKKLKPSQRPKPKAPVKNPPVVPGLD